VQLEAPFVKDVLSPQLAAKRVDMGTRARELMHTTWSCKAQKPVQAALQHMVAAAFPQWYIQSFVTVPQ
jgi:hypothetical protein